MAASAYYETVQKLYIAFYQRPADQEGLEYWANRLDQVGGNATDMINAFATSLEARTLYGPINAETIGNVINSIYQGLFGRDADPEGLAFYSAGFANGTFTPGTITLNILNGAKNQDLDIISNKLQVAQQFTALYDTYDFTYNEFSVERVRDMLAEVTADTDPQDFNGVEYLLAHPGGGVFTLTENVIVTDAVLADITPIIKNVTYIGFNPHAHGETGVDNLDGNNPDGNDNNLTNETITDGGVPLYDLNADFEPAAGADAVVQKGFFSYIADLTGLDFVQLGLINVGDDVGTLTDTLNGNVTIGDIIGDSNTTTVTVTAADGTVHTAEVDINNAYFKLLTNLVFDEESNLRLFEKQVAIYPKVEIELPDGSTWEQTVYQYVSEAETTTIVPIILTPTVNNGGTRTDAGEYANPTRDNDLIVAGRLELLHQAYIDAGAGESNTLEVDAKGYYAQPAALLNIQHVIVHNLPNVYSADADVEGDSGNPISTYPDLSTDFSSWQNSVLDLSRAVDIETLTVTESDFQGLDAAAGSLTITGIRNGAVTTLDGGFTQDVYLNYSDATADGIHLVFNNLSMGDEEGAWGAQLVVAHDTEKLTIESTGGGNFLDETDLGGALSTLVITGDATLYIKDDLDASFHNATPVTIDASANTAGVNLELSGSEKVTFLGSSGNDRFLVSTQDTSGLVGDDGSDDAVTIVAKDGNNHFEVESSTINITAGNGDNNIELDGTDATVVVGDGNNNINVGGEEEFDSVTVTAGNGDNTINTDGTDVVSITVGTGDNTIQSLEGESVTVIAAGGDNAITVEADVISVTTGEGSDTIYAEGAEISIAAGGTGNSITVVGTDGDYTAGDDGAMLQIDAGTNSMVTLGRGVELNVNIAFAGTLVAKEGSSITGENLTLVVDTVADLRAAELSGISRIILDDDALATENSPQANDADADRALLTLLDTQVAELVAAGTEISVEGGIFNTSAHIKVVVTQNLDVTTGAWAAWMASLPASVDLKFELNDGTMLTITAQQLHTKVASEGITIADDGNTDQLSGKVYIKGAGLDFDPFNNSDQVRTEIEGREYVGGSLSADFVKDVGGAPGVADEMADGVQRGEWGFNVLLDRTLNGYNRPADAPSYSRLVIDTDEMGGSVGPFATIETFLRIVGDADMAFVPVKGGIDEWGRPIEGGTAIQLGVDNGEPTNTFMVDFSSATGAITNLTLAHFENADAIYGNGTEDAPARVNVELGGNVGDAEQGLVSRGVQTYVVTDLNDADRQFWTCVTTEDLEALGLRGNYGNTVTFGNTERGVEFLLEVAYSKADGYAVGTVVADFARDGADAVFNVVGLQALPAGEVQKIEGINATDADTITINVQGGDTVIESLVGDNETETLTLTADADLTIEGDLISSLESVDASGVEGALIVTIDSPTASDIVFVGAAGSTDLTLSDVSTGDFASIGGEGEIALTVEGSVNLSETELSNVTTVTLDNGSTLTLTMEQADVIGAANFVVAEGESATLNLLGLNDQPFALANYDVEGTLTITLTLAEVPEVTLHPDTDLTGISALEIPEGTTLYLTMAQFQQLEGDGSLSGAGSVVITGVTQADVGEAGVDLDMDGVDVGGTITLVLAESVDLSEADLYSSEARLDRIELGDDMTVTLGDIQDADGVEIVGGANSVLKFTDTDTSPFEDIDASGFDVTQLMFTNTLTQGGNRNIDDIFTGLAESITKVIYNGEGFVMGIDQVVDIVAGTTVTDSLVFNPVQDDVELTSLTLNLLGGVEISGNVRVSTDEKQDGNGRDLIRTYLQKVTINSTGTEANLLSGATANIITGDLTPASGAGGQTNNLLDLEINAEQDFVVEGDVVFASNVGGDGDSISANDIEDAVAVLTVNGEADVTLGGVDLTDGDVVGLNVINNGTGTLSLTLDGADSDEELSFTGTGPIELTVTGTVDLSDDTLDAVTQITIAEDAELTLSFAQIAAIGAENIVSGDTDDTVDEALNIVGYDGSAFDFSALSDELVINVTMASGNITLDPAVDLTGVDSITVPEGGTLTLTAEQFQQLTDNGAIVGVDADGAPSTDFTVNIVGLTQAIVDADVTAPAGTAEVGDGFKLTGVTADTITVTTAEDVNFDDNTDLNGASISIGGFALGLATEAQADELVVSGTAGSTVTFMFDIVGPIDAAGYDVETLRALAVSVDGEDVEFLIDNLASSVTLNLYEDPNELGFVSPIFRVVTIEPGVEVPGDIVFNGQDGDREVRTLTINFTGDATDRTQEEDQDGNLEGSVIAGSLILDLEPATGGLIASKFDKLVLNSAGVGSSNAITGGITAIAQGAINPGATANQDNNLVDIEINAEADFAIGGAVIFNSTAAALDEATLTINGTADVTIQSLDVSDADIDVLNIVNNAGTLTITGASPSIEADATESIVFSGTGDVVLGTAEQAEDFADGIDGGGELSSIDASGLSGDLSIENITSIDEANFSFVSGTGVTTVRVSNSTLNDDDAPAAEPGWSFDLSDAAAGSQLTFGAGLTFTDGDLNVDLGSNAVLYITADTDWTALDDVNITGTIVLGAGVDLTLTAAQASGLTIIPDPAIIVDENDPAFVAGDVPTVTLEGLGDAAYDFSGIMAGVQDNISTATKLVFSAMLVDNDVTIDALADLGDLAIKLSDVANGVAVNDELAGQTIRFNTPDQAERIIVVDVVNGERSTNVVWLFQSLTAPVDTSNYDADIARLWLTQTLANGANIEDLFTTLPNTIIRVDFANLQELEELLVNQPVDREVELASFTNLPAGLIFNDQDVLENVETLTISMGGQVTVGDLVIDNIIDNGGNYQSAPVFTSLTINSVLADDTGDLLAREGFDEEVNVKPNSGNTIGDISVGSDNNIDLLDVTLNTGTDEATNDLTADSDANVLTGTSLTIGTITYDSEVADSEATLTLVGRNDITIAAMDTSDADITGLTIDAVNFFATLDPVMNMDNTESLTIDNNGFTGSSTFEITVDTVDNDNELLNIDYVRNGVAGTLAVDLSSVDVTDVDAVAAEVASQLVGLGLAVATSGSSLTVTAATGTFAFVSADVEGTTDGLGATGTGDVSAPTIILQEVEGDELSVVDVSDYGGALQITFSQIDSNNDDSTPNTPANDGLVDAFTYTAGTGDNDVVVAAVGGNIPTLESGSTWNFDFSGNGEDSGSTLTIGEGVVFEDGAILNINLGADTVLYIDDSVDLSGVDLTITGGVIEVLEGQTLTLTVEQVAALHAGSIEVIGLGTVAVVDGDQNGTDFLAVYGGILRAANVDLSALTFDDVADTLTIEMDVEAGVDNAIDFGGIGQTITGTSQDDTITVYEQDNVLNGGNGDDTLNGGDGDDTLNGGAGDDTLTGGDGDDTFNVASGTDTVTDLTTGDILVVAAGATADATTAAGGFVATAETTNAGTATITAVVAPPTGLEFGDGTNVVEIDIADASAGSGLISVIATVNGVDFTITDSLDASLGGDALESDLFGSYFLSWLAAGAVVLSVGAGGVDGIFTVDFAGGTVASVRLVPNSVDDVLPTANNGVLLGSESEVDMTLAGGTVGYTITGDAGDNVANTLTGSAFADTINGGDSGDQDSTSDVDVLTGNGGADVFVFTVATSTPAEGAITTPAPAVGVDQEVIEITVDGNDDDNEGIVIGYTVNQTNAALVVDLSGADVTDEESIATAIATALGGVVGLSAEAVDNGGGDWDVVVEGVDGNKVSINAATGTGTLTGLAFNAVNGTDVAHQEELTITGTSGAAGEIYTATVTLADGTVIEGKYITAGAGETAGDIATGIADDLLTGFNTIAPALTVLATDAGAVVTFDDENADDGAFTLSFTAAGGISGTGASDLAATYAYADIIVDFLSGTDKISFGDDAGTVANYEESATVAANYASALASAEANFDGTVKYYFTWIEATAPEAVTGVIAEGDDVGLLFFDLNGDEAVDGVVRLVGVDSTEFTHTDIIA